MNRMRQEIIHLRALTSSQQQLIATLAADSEMIRKDKFTLRMLHYYSSLTLLMLLLTFRIPVQQYAYIIRPVSFKTVAVPEGGRRRGASLCSVSKNKKQMTIFESKMLDDAVKS